MQASIYKRQRFEKSQKRTTFILGRKDARDPFYKFVNCELLVVDKNKQLSLIVPLVQLTLIAMSTV